MSTEHDRPFREQALVFGPALLITLLGFLFAYQFVDPAPPKQIRIATGQQEGAYYLFSQKYQAVLEREGIELQLINTAGSIENIRLLEEGKADIAFVQGGVTEPGQESELHSLGSLFYEPIWLFHRQDLDIARLSGLGHKRIAVGPEGSGTRALSIQLLGNNSVNESNSSLLSLGGRAAADALLAGHIDAAFFVASPQSPVVRALLDSQQIRLMDFFRADAYTRIHRYLSRVLLPQGVVNLSQNQPQRDTILLAATANLVVHSELHPALVDLLLQAATEVHGSGGWFELAGQFPTPDYLVFSLATEARRFYKYGPPFLQRYLPFWAATLVDRLKVMLLPLVALMLPLFKIMPPLYRWRMRSRIYPWYREVLAIDRQLYQSTPDIEHCLADLSEIEREVSKISVPLSFAEELYDLRLHISMVRERLEKRRDRA